GMPGASARRCCGGRGDFCEDPCGSRKSQLIDLLAEGFWEELLDIHQPEIHISDWWGARADCGCKYSLHVRLLAADRRAVLATFEAQPEPVSALGETEARGCSGPPRLHGGFVSLPGQVSHVFRHYGPGVRYIHFCHRGKDTQFWAGHYGARVTHSAVVLRLGPPAAPLPPSAAH
uniref:F-box only protein 27-like n=1 Tax=Dromaius novaehollandiae TaxID=8790 RepID=A0A8C4JM78_DRONO